ncbi:MAG: hypothetical protein K8H86_07290, partial [Ignavibacteriaceae bacterium]|nr:hypothetical protein [Ignavibacteriaceae bacterium]
EYITIKKDSIDISGYPTHNKNIVDEVISQAVIPNLDVLKKLPKNKIVNELTILTFNIYQTYIGKSFYRWGGDIFDLDDPQAESVRFTKSYGLDCSGFATSGYELAVYYNLLSPNEALFSSKGFSAYCLLNNLKDSGGRDDTPNNYRVDTKELAFLGEEIFKINRNTSLDDHQIKQLQAGDIMGKNGHFGIIVEINNQLYYLESGGWVLSKNEQKPVPIKEAIVGFAKHGPIYIRRCLPRTD